MKAKLNLSISSNRSVSSWIAHENRLKSVTVSVHVVTELSLVSKSFA